MGTVFSFDVHESGVPDDALDAAVALLHRIDATFSTYRADSVINQLDRGEVTLDAAPADVRFVLSACALWSTRTRGWFSAYPAGRLDPSGYVKGWAIEQTSELLRAAGSTSHCINGGGDVQCVGDAAPGRPWRVGITNPRDPTALVTVISGTGLAVATSGSAERGTHILNPFTGQPPVDPLLSLTISGASLIECDVYATAGFAMGADGRNWLTELGDVRAFAVTADGSTWST